MLTLIIIVFLSLSLANCHEQLPYMVICQWFHSEVKSFDSFVARMGEGKGQILTQTLFHSISLILPFSKGSITKPRLRPRGWMVWLVLRREYRSRSVSRRLYSGWRGSSSLLHQLSIYWRRRMFRVYERRWWLSNQLHYYPLNTR
jgi:hypothetical protein